jgi:hypothetical protein
MILNTRVNEDRSTKVKLKVINKNSWESMARKLMGKCGMKTHGEIWHENSWENMA